MRNFDSITFALPIALIYTDLLGAAIYGEHSNYFGGRFDYTDDDRSDDGGVRKESGLFLLYSIGFTLFICFIQSYTGELAMDEDITILFEPDTSSTTGTGSTITRGSRVADSEKPEELRRISLIDELYASIQHFYNTVCAYLIGASWTLWARMTFILLFNFPCGLQLGYFMYASAISIAALLFITLFKKLLKEEENKRHLAETMTPSRAEKILDQLIILVAAASRLAVGWLWEDFINSVVNLAGDIGNDHDPGLRWLVFFIKILAAGTIFLTGWVYRRGYDEDKNGGSNYYDVSRGDKMTELQSNGSVKRNAPRLKSKSKKTGGRTTNAALHSPLL